MKKQVLIAVACASLAACGLADQASKPDTPYGSKEKRDQVLRPFIPICLEQGSTADKRGCPEYPFIVYQLADGKKVVGRVHSINLETGALSVLWSTTMNAAYEDFYPGSSKSVSGSITEILNDRPKFDYVGEGGLVDMSKAELAQYYERQKKAMGRYGELEELYSKQPAITLVR